MRLSLLLGTAGLISLLAFDANAADCSAQLLDGHIPALTNIKLGAKTRELCFEGYAVLHSGITRTPLWAAEHLTQQRLSGHVDRVDAFHAEPSLPGDERADLNDYNHSGYDRGHMAPSGDMPDQKSQEESFSLANMVPQKPELNRQLWEHIEATVRELTKRDGEVWVLTGPAFQGAALQRLNGRVLVPTATWKAIWDPKIGLAGAYLAPNDASQTWKGISLSELQGATGIDAFPTLPQAVKDRVMKLPEPQAHGLDQHAGMRKGRHDAMAAFLSRLR